MKYDVIIAGAGSAGCVLANRLSEDAARSVLLVEAGPDYPQAAALPPDIASGDFPTYSHDWDYYSEPDGVGRMLHLPRGKLVGGCSATNAAFALRGAPDVYDEWATRGNPGWSFVQVLPHFRRLENDLDFRDEWHGQDGPLPIRRFSQRELNPVQTAFLEACSAAGYARVDDHNALGAGGAGPTPRNAVAGIRQSTALTYLARARRRPNLTIQSETQVDRVLFDGRRAVGIRTVKPAETLTAGCVILATGSYGSPAILMRSGLGPADHLKMLGINVLEDLIGVGTHLIDHPLLGVRYVADPKDGANSQPLSQTLLALKSSQATQSYDLLIFPTALFPAERDESPTGTVFILFVALVRPFSRGQLLLRSPDPGDAPRINLNYFTHPQDLPRMVEGVRVAQRLARTAPLADLLGEESYPGASATATLDDLKSAVRAQAETFHHPVGTCHMGPAGEAEAVVDQRGQVRGVDGLFVVDASIMPTIPSAPTNLATIMVAERCAALLMENV